jgi:hypothetical protein
MLFWPKAAKNPSFGEKVHLPCVPLEKGGII